MPPIIKLPAFPIFNAVPKSAQLQDPEEEAKAIAAEKKKEAQAKERAEAKAIAEEEKQRRAQSPEAFSEGQAAPGNQVCF